MTKYRATRNLPRLKSLNGAATYSDTTKGSSYGGDCHVCIDNTPIYSSARLGKSIQECLPEELLSAIFVECLPSSSFSSFLQVKSGENGVVGGMACSSTHFTDISEQTAPLTLLKVSRKWRRIALSTPMLFTRLILIGEPTVSPFKIISLWLDHSGILPLDVFISSNLWRRRNVSETDIIGALTLLRDHMHRIRSLAVTPDETLVYLFPPTVSAAEAKILQLLHFNRTLDSRYLENLSTISAPNLRAYWGFLSRWPKTIAFNDRLEVIGGFNALAEKDVVEIGLMTPNIQQMAFSFQGELSGMSAFSRPTWSTPTISLNLLRKLFIRVPLHFGGYWPVICAFLERLRTPNLEEFGLYRSTFGAFGQISSPSPFTFLSECKPPLRTLELEGISVVPDHFRLLLPELQQLQHLAIRDAYIATGVLKLLTIQESVDSESPICLRLTSLSFIRADFSKHMQQHSFV
ncbi:hypothetical protein M422DRAFT_41597 [Sphaerobolus stellatus SS14]|nr:hypothetical protein M422DRAFT_41597 [Sphaerobolus stellatus SS14]